MARYLLQSKNVVIGLRHMPKTNTLIFGGKLSDDVEIRSLFESHFHIKCDQANITHPHPNKIRYECRGVSSSVFVSGLDALKDDEVVVLKAVKSLGRVMR